MIFVIHLELKIKKKEKKDTVEVKPVKSREFLWQGHTAHATKEDADKVVLEALDHYRHIYEEYFAVPVVKGMKSEKKFAGARYTTRVEKLVVVYKVQRCLTSHSQIKKEKIKGVAEFLGL
ncbi:unnamed protein product [Brassica oleracea]